LEYNHVETDQIQNAFNGKSSAKTQLEQAAGIVGWHGDNIFTQPSITDMHWNKDSFSLLF